MKSKKFSLIHTKFGEHAKNELKLLHRVQTKVHAGQKLLIQIQGKGFLYWIGNLGHVDVDILKVVWMKNMWVMSVEVNATKSENLFLFTHRGGENVWVQG